MQQNNFFFYLRKKKRNTGLKKASFETGLAGRVSWVLAPYSWPSPCPVTSASGLAQVLICKVGDQQLPCFSPGFFSSEMSVCPASPCPYGYSSGSHLSLLLFGDDFLLPRLTASFLWLPALWSYFHQASLGCFSYNLRDWYEGRGC